jgi:hypothetical protein
LFFVCYYQGRLEEAEREADIVLSVLPDDPVMPRLKGDREGSGQLVSMARGKED